MKLPHPRPTDLVTSPSFGPRCRLLGEWARPPPASARYGLREAVSRTSRLTCAAVGAVGRAAPRYPRDALETPAPPLGGVAGFLPPVDAVDVEVFLPGR